MKPLAGIVGYRGYSGAELARLLQHHPRVTPVLLEHREDTAAHSHPKGSSGPRHAQCTPEAVLAERISIVFLATPPQVSMELAPALLAAGAKVIDLSGAFRLRTPAAYAAWYNSPHTQPELLAEAAYGLPEFCRDRSEEHTS